MDKLQQSDAERIEEQQEQQPAPMMMGKYVSAYQIFLRGFNFCTCQ